MDEEILLTILSILNEHGIERRKLDYDEILEMDSIEYISVIVSLEEKYKISISDEYLVSNEITINKIYNMIISSMK